MKASRVRTMNNLDRAKAPVFVVGCPRSGTTFLYHTILSSGNFAVYLAESGVFNMIAPAFGDLRSESNRRRLMDAWLQSDYFQKSGLRAEEIRAEVLSGCRNPGDFLRMFMERIAQNQGVDRWADNTPNHLLHIAQIKATIPNALIIHIIRDGRDVAMSLHRSGWGWQGYRFPWDSEHGLLVSALYWEWIVRKGRECGRRLGGDYLEVRYEDLVHQARETLKVLSTFIRHDLDYERIRRNGIGTVKAPNSSFSDSNPHHDAFNPIGRWKGLSGVESDRMEALLGPLLEDLGYELSRPVTVDFTARRLRAFYFLYRDVKQVLKRSRLSKFLICRDRLGPGYLDRELSRWPDLGGWSRARQS
jgi:sulfotransferase family protein